MPYIQAADVDELNVTALSPNLVATAPDASSPWSVSVPSGAVAECGELLRTEWSVCGRIMGSGLSMVYLDLPDPVSMSLSTTATRLSPPDDDATSSGIGVQSAATLQVIVAFDDGAQRDMTLDSRVSYVAIEGGCTEVLSTSGARRLSVLTGAACSSVTISASVFGFVQNVTLPLVRLHSLVVDFSGYPNVSPNANIAITQLGLVECMSSTYHHATARARAYLSDAPTSAYTVTSYTTFSSSDEGIIKVEGTRMKASAAGSADITAVYGSSPSSASATLEVVSNVTTPVSTIGLSSSLDSSETLRLEMGSSQSATVSLVMSNGVTISNVASADWLSLSDLIGFSSDLPAAASIGASTGVVTQHDNWYDDVSFTATLACDSVRTGVLKVLPNLHPAQADLDLGQETGAQFQQSGTTLAVPVRVRAPSGHRLINFQVSASFDTALLTSSTDGGASGVAAYVEGSWSGVESTLNDPPSWFQVTASDTQSTLSGVVDLGTVTLNVVGSGVTLISGYITELITLDGGDVQTRTQGVAAVAGTGYAFLTSRRRLSAGSRLRGVLSSPSEQLEQLATYRQLQRAQARRRTQSCDACTAGIYGDVSGDCSFSSADVLEIQQLASQVQSYKDGQLATDPLAGLACDWLRAQANPSLDVTGGGNEANVDLVDAQFLQLAVAKKYRFLDDVTVACAGSDLRVRARVLKGETTVSSAGTASSVDVLVELVSTDFASGTIVVSLGSRNTDRGLSASNAVLANAVDVGDGYFETRLRPSAGWSVSGSVGVSILVESKDSSGNKEVPRRYKAFHGASIEPYASQGISFAPLLTHAGGCQQSPPPPFPPPSPPPPSPPLPSSPPPPPSPSPSPPSPSSPSASSSLSRSAASIFLRVSLRRSYQS